MIFVGVDWAEAHNDVLVMDKDGVVLGRGRFSIGVAGLGQLHALVGQSRRGAKRGESSASRSIAACWSTRWSAPVTASTQSIRWRPVATAIVTRHRAPSRMPATQSSWRIWCAPTVITTGRSPETPRRLARSGCLPGPIRASFGPANARSMPCARRCATTSRRRSRHLAPSWRTPMPWRSSQSPRRPSGPRDSRAQRSPLRCAARVASATSNERAIELQTALRTEQPEAPSQIAEAFGQATAARVAVLVSLNQQIAELERALLEHFDRHPDAEILKQSSRTRCGPRRPGAWRVLRMTRAALPILEVARPTLRTAPITKASGRSMVVLARVARNRRLADACERWAFCSLPQAQEGGATTTHCGPAARPTPRRPASSPTAGWAFSTLAWSDVRPIRRTSLGRSVRRWCA